MFGQNNLVPVFVDVEPLSYCIDVSKVESQVNDKTVAILAPNLMGNLCDWSEIRKIADKHGLVVIEDSADTLGAKIGGKPTGYYSDMSITKVFMVLILSIVQVMAVLSLSMTRK